MKSTWKIINSEKGTTNQYEIGNIFNKYSSSVADSINVDNNRAKVSSMNDPTNYLYKYHSKPFILQ
jgi:hypothetical protein